MDFSRPRLEERIDSEPEIIQVEEDISIQNYRIGDEVQYDLSGRKFVVTCVNGPYLSGIGKDGMLFADKNLKRWHKTGRYFPEAIALINALENDEEDKLYGE